ncbi:MAG: Clostripain family protein, partial [Lachnospiraceae bacterium]|nr:Clostripain family protein [Lachnospiraceae bacterium]
MKRRWIALLLTLSMCTGLLGGCGEDDDALVTGEGDGGEVTAENGDGAEGGGSASPVRNLEGASTRLQVSRTTGEMTITRSPFGNKSMGADGTWTIFVYLCGADLESENGMATGDLQEMLDANASDQVHFVVQTGGANSWDNGVVDAGKIQRFVVEGNDLKEVYSESRRSMADVSTLTDFLRWGISEYPAEHMGVVFWDHGSGSINGVCFDETDHDNSLALRDLDNAFLSITDTMTDRFEFIGFDACLMGTIEAANILASYADYMIASVETEPGGGWDYEAIGKYLSSNPKADGLALGKIICDSFMKACQTDGDMDLATLSVIDLQKVDDFLIRFNTFAHGYYDAGAEVSKLS